MGTGVSLGCCAVQFVSINMKAQKTATKPAAKAGKNSNGKSANRLGVITIEGESARMLREASEVTGEPPAILFAACVKRFAENLRENKEANRVEDAAMDFRAWLDGIPNDVKVWDDKGRHPRIPAAVGPIELDMVDWMRVLKLSRTNGLGIDWTLGMLIEGALEREA